MLNFIKKGIIGVSKIIGLFILYALVICLVFSITIGAFAVFDGDLEPLLRGVGGIWVLFWIFLAGVWVEDIL